MRSETLTDDDTVCVDVLTHLPWYGPLCHQVNYWCLYRSRSRRRRRRPASPLACNSIVAKDQAIFSHPGDIHCLRLTIRAIFATHLSPCNRIIQPIVRERSKWNPVGTLAIKIWYASNGDGELWACKQAQCVCARLLNWPKCNIFDLVSSAVATIGLLSLFYDYIIRCAILWRQFAKGSPATPLS